MVYMTMKYMLFTVQIARVGTRTQEMWKDHVALTTSFPDASLPPDGKDGVSPDIVRRKRLVYRSKQRGWLEVIERLITASNV